MLDPVIMLGSGHTYERYNIESWFKSGNASDPATNTFVVASERKLIANKAVRSVTLQWVDEHGAPEEWKALAKDITDPTMLLELAKVGIVEPRAATILKRAVKDAETLWYELEEAKTKGPEAEVSKLTKVVARAEKTLATKRKLLDDAREALDKDDKRATDAWEKWTELKKVKTRVESELEKRAVDLTGDEEEAVADGSGDEGAGGDADEGAEAGGEDDGHDDYDYDGRD